MSPQPQFIDLSIRPRHPTAPAELRSLAETSEQLREGIRRHQELYGGTAKALRLHSLPTTVPIDLISQLYELCAAKKEQAAVEKLLARLEDDLRTNKQRFVDDVLKRLEVEKLAPAVLVAALTITIPAKGDLHEREGFLDRVEGILRRTLGDERTAALLASRR